ncbi:ORF112R [Scale drop disease virus]|nr:ORF112R [Scale drop disease virus]UNH60671.1 hypothetical protein SDDV_ORF002 [Scale drop disease virus]
MENCHDLFVYKRNPAAICRLIKDGADTSQQLNTRGKTIIEDCASDVTIECLRAFATCRNFALSSYAISELLKFNTSIFIDVLKHHQQFKLDLNKALMISASLGEWNMMRRVLKILPDFNRRQLAFTSMSVKRELVFDHKIHDILVKEHGVNFDIYDEAGNSPLYYALQSKYIHGVYFMLIRGKGLNVSSPDVANRIIFEALKLQDEILLHWVIKTIDLDIVNRTHWEQETASPLDKLLDCTPNINRKFFKNTFVYLTERYGCSHLTVVPDWMTDTYKQYNTLFYRCCAAVTRKDLRKLKSICNLPQLLPDKCIF